MPRRTSLEHVRLGEQKSWKPECSKRNLPHRRSRGPLLRKQRFPGKNRIVTKMDAFMQGIIRKRGSGAGTEQGRRRPAKSNRGLTKVGVGSY